MSTTQKILLALAVVIALVLLYLNWDKLKSLFRGSSTKGPVEGSPCSTTGGLGSNNNGTYVNGTCVAKVAEGSLCTTDGGNDGTIIGGMCIKNIHATPKPMSGSGNIKI